VRQALKVSTDANDSQGMPRVPAVLGSALLLAIEKDQLELLQYLLGEDFIDIWGQPHLDLVTQNLKAFNRSEALQNVFAPEGETWNVA